ncbi:5'-methylthioadenosine/adenosylhomocysteine nucleosidase [Spirochaeta cellobiosiphila]|uniref:5'-methylthioadenosine/adenosylhomocysteine nucleosidase n=1 Tax=Spirochaeta cellobiosiphila TaxID=504483 RepID=UPI00048A58EA|nr:5'-methylthioadenosine/adenosylhomocysteine nucleosidase [Spirochaeta cellobiosiphila]
MTIGIIAAMQEEMVQIKATLESLKEEKVEHLTLFRGTRHNHTLLVMESGIGKVNAAIATQILISKHHPDYIINTGVAGGYDKRLDLLDITIGSHIAYHDVDVTAFEYKRGQLPKLPLYFSSNQNLLNISSKINIDKQKVIIGNIYSGDIFIHTEKQVDELKKNFPDVVAVEMEGAAIAQTCYLNSIPFLVIRSISDLVFTKDSHTTYKDTMEQAAIISSCFIDKIIKTL